MADTVLEVQDLSTHFFTEEGIVRAVDGVSIRIRRGQILALVGESGSGKTTLGLSILRLVPHPGRVVHGRVLFQGQDLLTLGEEELRRLRGRAISMIFQDPVAGLNPVLPVGTQVQEILDTHLHLSKHEGQRRTLEILRRTGVHDPERVARSFPWQLSGGTCQRVMIGIATALSPELLIADEPTSALDVTVQAQILREIERLRDEHGMAILLITHAMGVVAQVADEVAVMYGGKVVEQADVHTLFRNPRHPYTWALLAALPRVDADTERLPAIPGSPPLPEELTGQCPFLPRCRKAVLQCRTQPAPPLEPVEDGHRVACYNPMLKAEE